jgi:dolichol-phosphate mannosyltransferase
MAKLTVVLPTYNEKENLPLMVEALFNLGLDNLHLLVVDDNSPDGTGQIADEFAAKFPERMTVLHRTDKDGLGPAYRAGFRQAIANGADYIVQMDADFSHQPKYIPQMLEKLESGADLILGSRFIKGGSVDENWGFYRKLLSWWANRLYVPMILGVPVYDATGGFRMWRRETLIGLDLDQIESNGYVFQVEMAYVTAKLGYKIIEIPIHFPDRQHGTSKMNSRVALEAAWRTWSLRRHHHHLTEADRRTQPYEI